MIADANHVTAYDPLVVAHYLYDSGRPPTILAKASLFKVPVLGWVLRKTGQVPVYRGTATARAALDAGLERSEEHTSELQSRGHLVCRLLLEKKKTRRPSQ